MRTLVTGASGFLGSRVVRELRNCGHEVVAAGRRAEALPDGPSFVGDLADLAEARIPVDTVIHCAALSSPWGPHRDFVRSNVDGTRSVVAFARRNGARRIVHVSSPSVYAATHDRLDIPEQAVEARPGLNSYIRTKLAAEAVLRDESERPDAPEIVILRPRGIVGPGDRSLVPRLLAARERTGIPLFRGGRNLVDLTPVESAARAVRLAATVPGAAGGTFNVTNGEPRPFRDLVEHLLGGLGLEPRWRPMDARAAYAAGAVLERVFAMLPGRPEPPLTRYTVTTLAYSQTLDIHAARRVLGYEPAVPLDASLAGYARA